MIAGSSKVQRMDREILLRQLAQAEQSVAEGRACIAQQQRLIVVSERDGDDTAKPLRVLEKFLKVLESRELDRLKLLDELHESP